MATAAPGGRNAHRGGDWGGGVLPSEQKENVRDHLHQHSETLILDTRQVSEKRQRRHHLPLVSGSHLHWTTAPPPMDDNSPLWWLRLLQALKKVTGGYTGRGYQMTR